LRAAALHTTHIVSDSDTTAMTVTTRAGITNNSFKPHLG
jgi:hypothetical protein